MPDEVRVKRVYDEPEASDGSRVLVDRVWPRGISKEKAAVDRWAKDVAPSTELRRWYGHDPDKFTEFAQRYRAELRGSAALEQLRQVSGRLTLVTATRAVDISQAAVLATLLSP
ncbi:MAG: DUF488 family protein [Jatrophihabitans sp.]|nr:MAG: DUF488 family protein [Jatrophihabitans sp.]